MTINDLSAYYILNQICKKALQSNKCVKFYE